MTTIHTTNAIWHEEYDREVFKHMLCYAPMLSCHDQTFIVGLRTEREKLLLSYICEKSWGKFGIVNNIKFTSQQLIIQL